MTSNLLLKCVSAAAMLTAFGAAQASAQEAANTASDFSGAYAGGQFGRFESTADHGFANGAPSGDSEPEGWVYGVHAGYNWRNANTVWGVEADIEGGSVEGDYSDSSGIGSSGAVELSWQASLRGRFGFVSGSNLFYATGGVVMADAEFSGGPFPAPPCCGYSDTATGWTAGAGWERVITSNMSARLEYRHTEFERQVGGLEPTFPGVDMDVAMSSQVLRGGVSFHF